MSKILHNTAAVATIIVAIVTIAGYFISSYTSHDGSKVQGGINYSPATIFILGSGTKLTIKKGSKSTPLNGGAFSSSGTEQTLYLPLGQKLNLNIFGSGSDIGIEKEVMQFITVTSNASGTNVFEL